MLGIARNADPKGKRNRTKPVRSANETDKHDRSEALIIASSAGKNTPWKAEIRNIVQNALSMPSESLTMHKDASTERHTTPKDKRGEKLRKQTSSAWSAGKRLYQKGKNILAVPNVPKR